MIPTIGLEVHVQLATHTKIFCGCVVEFGAPPNKNVCPVCLGLPGALPVLNREVFSLGLRAVLALGGEVSSVVKFDRKNYFYPDLPKGYQISQFAHPLGVGGSVEIDAGGKTKAVRLNRLHLEEDAGKLLHDQLPDSSVVDLNRAGTPLAEIVTEPDLDSAEEAYQYLTLLKAILRSSGVSECDMEKGQLRCDANISVRKNPSDPLGKRVEVKNLNSFKAVRLAILHEITRQSAALENGEKLVQETRLWDDERQKTFTMRSKEDAHDFRYFPEPDLVPFFVKKEDVEKVRASLPEMPQVKKDRLMKEYKLSEYEARLDQAIDQAGPDQHGQDHPHSGLHGRAVVEMASCHGPAGRGIGPHAHARGNRPGAGAAQEKAADHQEGHSHLQFDAANRSVGVRLVVGRNGDGRAAQEPRRRDDR